MQDSIGPYRVEGEIGRGGMGVVYRGLDTRLDREVAIKALPEDLASDPMRLERFEREAKTLASVSSPNIAGIYGVEEVDGRRYLVLEMVEGDTLADRLDRGPLPVDEAIELAAQIAAGVAAAHDAGVVHRDLKPANVKITPSGSAKVLDFGLARTDEGQSSTGTSEAATLSTPMHQTALGMVVGTAAYMSPEQARGRRVDKRTDIWSFGVILYEMLVGASPFVGETASDSIGAVLHKEFDFGKLPEGTPASVRRVLERCLQRDREMRYRDIGDVRIELLSGGETEASEPGKRGLPLMPIGAAALVVAAGALAAGWFGGAASVEPEPRPVRKYTLERAPDGFGSRLSPISPDGTRIAYILDNKIHIRDLGSFESRVIPESEGADTLFWSPDSRLIGYTDDQAVYKISLERGGRVKVGDAPSRFDSASHSWTDDGRIIVNCGPEGIWQFNERGGDPTLLIDPEPGVEIDFHSVAAIPGTDALLLSQHPVDSPTRLVLYRDGERTELLRMEAEALEAAVYCPTGHILFQRGVFAGEIWAVGFDIETLSTIGDPFMIDPKGDMPSVSDDGTLSFTRGAFGSGASLAWVTPDGQTEAFGAETSAFIGGIVASPDGTRVAYAEGTPPNLRSWVVDLERGSRIPLSFEDGAASIPQAFSPDGSELMCLEFSFARGGSPATKFVSTDGTGATREQVVMSASSADEAWTVAIAAHRERETDMHQLRAIDLASPWSEDGPEQRVFYESRHSIDEPVIDPAGELVVFVSDQTGSDQLYCVPYPDADRRVPVTIDGADGARWSPDGATLFYRADSKVYSVAVTREPVLVFGEPELLFDADRAGLDMGFGWSVSHDGSRLIATLRTGGDDDGLVASIAVIENWYEEFRDRDGR